MVLENGRMQRLMLYLNLFAKCCVGWWLDDVPLVFCRTLPPEIGVTCDISKLRKLRFMQLDKERENMPGWIVRLLSTKLHLDMHAALCLLVVFIRL
jgi:hypothetical protein